MLQSLLNFINEGNLYYGLEIVEHNTKITFHLSEIKRKRGELLIRKTFSDSNLIKLVEIIKKNSPVILTLNTSDIVTKITPSGRLQNTEVIVHDQFPNLDFSSFYYSLFQNNGSTLVSIVKKDKISAYLDELSSLKINLFKIVLGVSEIQVIVPYLNTETLHISNCELFLENQVLKKITSFGSERILEQSKYEINNLTIGSNFILGFSSVLNYISKDYKAESNFDDKQSFLMTEFKSNRMFDLLLKTSLVCILVVLLFNFFVFSHYFEENNALKTMASFNTDNKKVLIELKEKVANGEERVETMLSTSNSKSSFFLDQIALTIPNSMSLSEIKYQPLSKPVRDSKAIEINKNIIIISGNSKNSKDFSKWIQLIESLEWIKQAQILEYDYENNYSSIFSIKIDMDEN